MHHHHHHHEHGHDHHVTEKDVSNIKVAFFLNLAFTLIELVGGLYTNSLAILTDALHDLGDCISLGLAWFFQVKSKQGRDNTYSYGYRRFSLVGAIANSLILFSGSIFILTEAVPRLFTPAEKLPDPNGMMLLAVLGISTHLFAAWRLNKGKSINERVVALHLLEDVLGWAAVLLAGIVMRFVHLPILDPILSIGIAVFILSNVYKNFRESAQIILQAIPAHIHLPTLEGQIRALPHVKDLHDMHLWSLDGEYHILSLHIVLDTAHTMPEVHAIKAAVRKMLEDLKISHATIEVHAPGEQCALNDR
jgi:cobalt-zinc-cadmium efflux system protein